MLHSWSSWSWKTALNTQVWCYGRRNLVFLALDVTIFGQKGGATSCIMLRRRHLKHNLGFTEVIHLMARVSTIITTRSEDIKTEGTKVN